MKKYIALFLSLALLFGTLALPAEAATDSFTKKTPSVTVKATSYNSAKVSFKKVSGAKGYIIYRKTSKSGKSKKIATVKSLSYVNKSLNCGRTYYYRVRAHKKKGKKTVYTKYSSWKSVKLSLSASAFTGASASRNKLTVGFKKVSGASGYCLYIAPKGGKEKLYYSGSATKKNRNIELQHRLHPAPCGLSQCQRQKGVFFFGEKVCYHAGKAVFESLRY